MRPTSPGFFVSLVFWCSFLLLPAGSSALGQSVRGLSIRITEAPASGGGPEEMATIEASVDDPEGACGPGFAECGIAFFSFAGGRWFPQPWLSRQIVEIDSTGLVAEKVHLGSRYAALVVPSANYSSLPESILNLPVASALAIDEAKAGARSPDAGSSSANAGSPAEGVLPSSLSASDEFPSRAGPSASSRPDWVSNLFRRPVFVILGAILFLMLSLTLSGQIRDFADAVEYSLRESIGISARRLRALRIVIRAKLNRETAVLLAAALCFVVAIGVAVANYLIVKFSFELLLPMSEALPALAGVFVLLKAVSGVLLHFFRGLARVVVVLALVLASVIGMALAHQRALAIQELSSSSSVPTIADPSVEGVEINETLLNKPRRENDLASRANDSTSHPEASLATRLFLEQPMLVAGLTLVIDIFEVLCIFGALGLSPAGVVWIVTLPLRLPLSLAGEGFSLVHRARLSRVVSILISAVLQTPRIIAFACAAAASSLARAALAAGKQVRSGFSSWGRQMLARWRRRRYVRIRRAAFLNRIQVREAYRTKEVRATFDHLAQMNHSLRGKASSVLDSNLDEIATLFTSFTSGLSSEAQKGAEEFLRTKGAIVAEGVATAAAEQFASMNNAQVSIDGFFPKTNAKSQAQTK